MFVKLIDDVRAWFVLRGLDASVVDGLESRNAQTNFGPGSANRVAFVPASPVEIIDAPRYIGEDDDGRRQLVNMLFAYEVSFAGYDRDNPERDLAHRHVCVDLFEATAQSLQRSAFGMHQWSAARWEDTRKHGRHGAELVVALTVNIPIFDTASPMAAPAPKPGAPKPVP